jgi:hypothetical protein
LTWLEASRGGELCPIDPRAAHASDIAEPVRTLAVDDASMAPRDREIAQPNGIVRPTTDGRAGRGDLERVCDRELRHEPDRGPEYRRERLGLDVDVFWAISERFFNRRFVDGPRWLADGRRFLDRPRRFG